MVIERFVNCVLHASKYVCEKASLFKEGFDG